MELSIKVLRLCTVLIVILWALPAFAQIDPARLPLLLKHAEHGDALSQYRLGVMYSNGEGVPQDDFEAAKWFKKAAEQGYSDAQAMLGLMHLYGRGVIRDQQKGCALVRASAEQGDRASIEIYNKHCAK